MASNFLIDGAKSFGQIASDSAQNIFNGVTRDNSLLNKVGNAGAFGLMASNAILGADLGQIETYEQKDYLKKLATNRIKETGNLSGNELGYSDYDKNAQWSTPNWNGLWSTNNVFTPNAAYANTLGATGFNVSETGGPVEFTGTEFDFKRNNGMFGLINSGGILNQDYGNNFPNYKPEKGKVTQNYSPEMNITPKEIQDIFGGGKLVHKGEGVQDRPEINSLNLDRLKQERKAKEQSQILADQSRRQQGQISKPPLAVVTPQTPQVPKQAGMMSSGPSRRSSRGGRKKAVAKPSRSNYSRKYSRLVGGR